MSYRFLLSRANRRPSLGQTACVQQVSRQGQQAKPDNEVGGDAGPRIDASLHDQKAVEKGLGR